jgi:DNA-binding MarR family transcriptional regulator
MSRYDPFDPQELREPAVPSEARGERKPEDNSPSIGRGGSNAGEQTASRDRTHCERNKEPRPRQQHKDRDRTYNLRESEIRTLAEIGSFRAVRTKDLVEFQYRGDERQADQELRNLKAQGLVQQKTLPGTEKEPLLTLTRNAREFLDRNRPQDVPRDQALYYGFVKPREARHDAEVYRLYQKVANDIEREGGTKLRVVLDFEFKKDLYRNLAKLKDLPPEQQAEEKERIAQEHGLKVVDGKIPLPDLRIEYETRDHEQARVDLELATQDYRERGLAEKSKAGFSIYAPGNEADRLRAALKDPELTREILTL